MASFLQSFNHKNFCSALMLIAASFNGYSQETSEKENNSNTIDIQPPSVSWNVEIPQLEKSNSGDENIWMEINTIKTLIIKHRENGRVIRGNILLLHGKGEHADHQRVVSPLAIQLADLGWQVIIPNIVNPDFPIQTIQPQTDISNDASPLKKSQAIEADKTNENLDGSNLSISEKPNGYFKSLDEYQLYFNGLIENIATQISANTGSFVVIAIEDSAFWLLDSLKAPTKISQVVLLDPEIPLGSSNHLDDKFRGQTLPVYMFYRDKIGKNNFMDSFSKKLWVANFQRFEKTTESTRKIEPENSKVAKSITGWIHSQIRNK